MGVADERPQRLVHVGRVSPPSKSKAAAQSGGEAADAISEEAAAASAAMKELGKALRESAACTSLQKLQIFGALDLEEELAEEEELILTEAEAAAALADGPAGDRKKYLAAAAQMKRRWELFLALYQYEKDAEPSLQMVNQFAAFMFHNRQRRSSKGRKGLGDSVAETAEWVLAQVRVALCAAGECGALVVEGSRSHYSC